jgi:hypothetical protein
MVEARLVRATGRSIPRMAGVMYQSCVVRLSEGTSRGISGRAATFVIGLHSSWGTRAVQLVAGCDFQ